MSKRRYLDDPQEVDAISSVDGKDDYRYLNIGKGYDPTKPYHPIYNHPSSGALGKDNITFAAEFLPAFIAGSGLPLAGSALKDIVNNPYVEAVSTITSPIDVSRGIVKGVKGIKNKQYGRGILSLAMAGLTGVTTIKGLSKAKRLIVTSDRNLRENTVRDLLTHPFSTINAVRQERYANTGDKVLSNLDRANNAALEGFQYTDDFYKEVTGLDMPKTRMSILPDGEYNFSGVYKPIRKEVEIPLQQYNKSNIARTNKSIKGTAAHEKVHANNDYLTETYGTPELGVFDRNYNYYVPNTKHPIAKKYKKKFMRGTTHSMHPEEHFANYLDAKAVDRFYPLHDFAHEQQFPPRHFIKDYIEYLSKTYNKQKRNGGIGYSLKYTNSGSTHRSLKDGGSGIYIKPSHRGRFNALRERTGHSATWFKENGTPAQKKMATFALNAAKWKH